MTDQTDSEKPTEEPPKIRIGTNGQGAKGKPAAARPTVRLSMPEAAAKGLPGQPDAATQARLEEELKRSTLRIDSAEEDASRTEAPPDAADAELKRRTWRIESPSPEQATAGGTESPEDEMKRTTLPIDTSAIAEAQQAAGVGEEEMKRTTHRIDLPQVERPKRPATPRAADDELKRTTLRIDKPVQEITAMADEDKSESAKKSTVRVHVEEAKKGDTQRLNTQFAETVRVGIDDKKKTTRININEVLEDEEKDIFKRRTALIDPAKFPQPPTLAAQGPRTIRIKQPQTPPTTVLKKTPTQPIQPISPQQAAAAAAASGAMPDMETPKKSETARIELPPDVGEQQPPTRRKTIRIKRPEGAGTTRTLVIARGGEESAEREAAKAARVAEEAEGAGPVFSALAMAAAVVMLVLLYVLAAQTIATGLPFPGRL